MGQPVKEILLVDVRTDPLTEKDGSPLSREEHCRNHGGNIPGVLTVDDIDCSAAQLSGKSDHRDGVEVSMHRKRKERNVVTSSFLR